MSVNELIYELQQLNRHEKWRVIQQLMNDLANEEQTSLLSHTEYEIWSPYDSAEAANSLLQLLEEPTHD